MTTGNAGALTFEVHEQCEAMRGAVISTMLVEGKRARLRGIPAGGMVWNPASRPDRGFQLRSGRIHIVSADAQGNETILRAIQTGEIFGEICLCSHADAPHGTSAVAINRCEILEAGYEDFRAQLKADADLTTSVLRMFCVRLAEADQRVQILAEHDARQRLRRLLAHIASVRGVPSKHGDSMVSVTITHAELAAFGALSRPHLSLLMSEFRDEGLVSYERGSALRIHVGKLTTYIP